MRDERRTMSTNELRCACCDSVLGLRTFLGLLRTTCFLDTGSTEYILFPIVPLILSPCIVAITCGFDGIDGCADTVLLRC